MSEKVTILTQGHALGRFTHHMTAFLFPDPTRPIRLTLSLHRTRKQLKDWIEQGGKAEPAVDGLNLAWNLTEQSRRGKTWGFAFETSSGGDQGYITIATGPTLGCAWMVGQPDVNTSTAQKR